MFIYKLIKYIGLSFILLFLLQNIVHAEDFDMNKCKDNWSDDFTAIDDQWLDSLESLTKQPQKTSDLIPYGISDYRTYVCGLQSICINVQNSVDENDGSQKTNLIGCIPQSITPYKECITMDSTLLSIQVKDCYRIINRKMEIEKVFLKSILHRDAYHKKTGILVKRYEEIIKKFHFDLWEETRLMVSNIIKFIDRSKCYLEQCDRGAGQETL